jgi:tRNA(adenine34) deaminase
MIEKFMRLALKEADKGERLDEIPIGAVIVKDGKVLAKAFNKRESLQDPTAHAEILAIKKASKKLKSWRLDGCEMFVTLEPCPMCAGAIVNSRIKRVVYGCYDKKAGALGTVFNLHDYPLNHKYEVEGGVLEIECALILSDFFSELRKKKKGTNNEI